LRQLRRLTHGLADPPIAALPLDDAEARPELRLFEALFARDALRACLAVEPWLPTLALSTLVRLAEVQGVAHDAAREEEPGRIPHEIRDPRRDPVARELTERSGWGWPYFGAVDTTPLFVVVLLRLYRRAGGP